MAEPRHDVTRASIPRARALRRTVTILRQRDIVASPTSSRPSRPAQHAAYQRQRHETGSRPIPDGSGCCACMRARQASGSHPHATNKPHPHVRMTSQDVRGDSAPPEWPTSTTALASCKTRYVVLRSPRHRPLPACSCPRPPFPCPRRAIAGGVGVTGRRMPAATILLGSSRIRARRGRGPTARSFHRSSRVEPRRERCPRFSSLGSISTSRKGTGSPAADSAGHREEPRRESGDRQRPRP